MYVYMYVYLCIYVCIFVYTCAYIFVYIYQKNESELCNNDINILIDEINTINTKVTHINDTIYAPISQKQVYMRIYTHLYTFIYIQPYMYVYMYNSMCVCVW